MLWMIPSITASIAASVQAKEARAAMQAYRAAGVENLKHMIGARCEYCRSTHAKNYCPNCGAPTMAQQRRNEVGR